MHIMDGSVGEILKGERVWGEGRGGMGGHLTVGLSNVGVIVQESFGAATQPSV